MTLPPENEGPSSSTATAGATAAAPAGDSAAGAAAAGGATADGVRAAQSQLHHVAYSELLYEVRAGVATITLNRPDRRNPIGPTTVGELLHALDRAKHDDAVRVVVLTGAGKVFSAGGDLSQMAQTAQTAQTAGASQSATPLQSGTAENRLAGTFVDLNLMLAGNGIGKPTIAKVNGHAMAGGLGLVVACDLAIAADDAQFATPEVNVGLWPMMIMATIFRNVPRKKAMELILTGDRLDAATAERLGLITRAVPRDRLDAEVQALCDKLIAKSPLIMRMGLSAFHATQDLELEPALRHLEGELARVLGTEDAAEGLLAFLQKRQAVWKGR
ncbi:MAG: enoyl-CoA hydratase-related protein [Polyangia bacterium]